MIISYVIYRQVKQSFFQQEIKQTKPFYSLRAEAGVGLLNAAGACPAGHQHYWKSGFTRRLGEEGIEIMIDFMSRKPSPLTFSYLQHLHGAAGRVPSTDTAFAHRGDRYDFAVLSMWPDPGAKEQNVAWLREFFEAMRPHLDDAVYVNNLGEEGAERVRAAYGSNYHRLKEVKSKYDPTNFFWSNQNIEPAYSATGGV